MPPAPEIDVTQGTTGEPQGAAAGSGMSDEEWLKQVEPQETPAPEEAKKAEPDPDEAFYSRLRSMDPTKLPKDIQAKIEAPFFSHWTRKFQKLSEQQRAIFDKVTNGLEAKGIQPTQDQKQELLERIKQGDFDVLGQFVERAVQDRVSPMQAQMAMRTAIEQAEAMNPYIRQRAEEIATVLRSDPVALELAKADNYRFAPQVFNAIANSLQLQDALAEIQKLKADRIAIEKAAIERYKKSVRELPATTSRAGTTQHGAQTEGDAKTFQEAAALAMKQMGLV